MMSWFLGSKTQGNVDAVTRIEQEVQEARSTLERVSDAVTGFVGNVRFVLAHAALFAIWVVVNSDLGPNAFDEYPYLLLNLALAVEAVLLSTFVLMSQRRQNAGAGRRDRLGVQVNLLAEREETKALQMLRSICGRLGMHDVASDRELTGMMETTRIEELAQVLEESRTAGEAPSPT
jgi:uncharacterized membrane protein